jgi:hypothetical protein
MRIPLINALPVSRFHQAAMASSPESKNATASN